MYGHGLALYLLAWPQRRERRLLLLLLIYLYIMTIVSRPNFRFTPNSIEANSTDS